MLTTWQKGIPKQTFPTLQESISSDVVIVGGGIAGISTAYFLSLAGKKVVVLEKNSIDKSVTALTTAFLTADIDTDPSDLCTIFGKRAARAIWKSGAHAIRTIEHIARAERISCDFSWTPVYFFATGEREDMIVYGWKPTILMLLASKYRIWVIQYYLLSIAEHIY
jgi:hypothetical protein